MAHVFISYHKNSSRDYARRLADYLIASGFDVWIDDRINYSDNWEQMIFKAVEQSSVVIVIMTPGSYQSRWVQAERLYAEKLTKPVFPVLLDGDIFPAYLAFQTADVRNGELPNADFLNDLEIGGAKRSAAPGRNVAQNPPAAPPKPHDVQTTTPVSAPVSGGAPKPKTTPTQQRRFEAAMPSQIISNAPTEVWAKISLPNSDGLRGELPAVVPSGDVIGKEDARASGFPFKFPLDPATGDALPVTVSVRAKSAALRFDEDELSVELPPDFDSRTVIFNAHLTDDMTPGLRVRVTLDLVYEGKTIAQISVSALVQTPMRVATAAAWMLASAAIGETPRRSPPRASTPPSGIGEVTRSGAGSSLTDAIKRAQEESSDERLRGGESASPPAPVDDDEAYDDDDGDELEERDELTRREAEFEATPADEPRPAAPQPAPITPPPARPAPSVSPGSSGGSRYGTIDGGDSTKRARPTVSLPPLALIASFALVIVVVIVLVQSGGSPPADSLTLTGQASSLLTDSAGDTPTETPTHTRTPEPTATHTVTPTLRLNVTRRMTLVAPTLRLNLTRAILVTQPAIDVNPALLTAVVSDPLVSERARVGIASTFEGCDEDLREQIMEGINGTQNAQSLESPNLDDLDALRAGYDLILSGDCRDNIFSARFTILKRVAPPEMFEFERIDVSESVDNPAYFALVTDALIAYLNGEFAAASELITEVLWQMPHAEQEPPFRLLKGNSDLFAGNYITALPAFDLATADENLLARAYNNRAIAMQEMIMANNGSHVEVNGETITSDGVLIYLETAHNNTSDAGQQAVILTNIGLAHVYFGRSTDDARARCGDALNFNPDHLLAYACLVGAYTLDSEQAECPVSEAAVETLNQSLTAADRLGSANHYAWADALYWQVRLKERRVGCDDGGVNDLNRFRELYAELRAQQSITLQSDEPG